MSVLAGREPHRVLYYFEQICSIPHGSGNEKQLSDYLVTFAKEKGLRCRQDEKYNVIIWKDGSPGYEDADPVILQGHMDMVAVMDEGVTKDMETEGLDLALEGDLLYAKGTSLGGDNGIGVAYMLAVLESDSLIHPPLEAIFTTGEEIDLIGAGYLDMSDLSGKMILNLDSEQEGVFTVSSAGGAGVEMLFPCDRECTQAKTERLKLSLSGLKGGHSGTEIHLGRLNANMAMGRLLHTLFRSMDIQLISINGGEKGNAIPDWCQAVIAVPDTFLARAETLIRDTYAIIKKEYSIVEPDMVLTLGQDEGEYTRPMSAKSASGILSALMTLPDGVQRMSPDIEGLVQTSVNHGVLRTTEDEISILTNVRSSSVTEKMNVIEKLRILTELQAGHLEVRTLFPSWEYKKDSRIRRVMVEGYRELYGEDPVLEGTHAALECGLFTEKTPDIDIISIGPSMYYIHTTSEKLDLESVRRTYDLLLHTLKKLVK